MKTEVLNEFVRLARNLNFRTTATELFISEAKLSRDIRALESELGYPVLERSRHKVALTPSGKKALEKAHEILDAYSAMLDVVGEKPRTLLTALVTRFPAISRLYLEARESMRRKWPDINFSDKDCPPANYPLDFLADDCELAISAYTQSTPANLEARVLFNYKLCVWMSTENDTLGDGPVSPRDLAGMTYVRTARGALDWDPYVYRLLTNEGEEFTVGRQIDSYFEFGRDEFTIMVDVDPSAFFGCNAKKLMLDPPLTVPIAVYSEKNTTSPVAREFIATLERVAQKLYPSG